MVLECRQLMSAFLYPAIKVKSVRVFVDYQIITQVKDLERVCQQAREADVVMVDLTFEHKDDDISVLELNVKLPEEDR